MLQLNHHDLAGTVRRIFDSSVVPVFKDHYDPAELAKSIDRMVFYIELLQAENAWLSDRRLVDLGAGLSCFALLAANFGLRCSVVDDFGGGGGVDPTANDAWRGILNGMQREGIQVVESQLLTDTLPFEDASVDIATSFHCLEHFHHSPKHLFEEIRRILKPGGVLLIGVPNSVNLRKRVSVLLGSTNHCALEEWYSGGVPFRGHVREPTLEELRRLLIWNRFEVRRTAGRNFIATASREMSNAPALLAGTYRLLLPVVDRMLSLAPTLCSDIHVLGVKPDR